MMNYIILISSAGATNGINVINALRESSLPIKIIAVDQNPLASGLFLADYGYVVPPTNDDNFIHKLIKICTNHQVDVALPIFSADFPAFIKYKKILAQNSVRTYTVPQDSLETCWNKSRVIDHLKVIGIPCPETWIWEEALNKAPLLSYPLFMKRIQGTGTKDARIIQNRKDLEYWSGPDYIFQEYLKGEEYTIDIMSDLKGKMLTASPRKRLRVYGGLSVTGVTVRDDEMIEHSRRIVESLVLPGPSNVQCIKDEDGGMKFYDVNPRFASGGLPLAVAAGINMPDILIKMLLGLEIPKNIRPKEGIYMIRHWNATFLKSRKGRYETID